MRQRIHPCMADENLLTGRKKGVDAFPIITDHRCRAGCSLKKANAGGITGPSHIRPRQIQCETLRVVESWMLYRCEMRLALDIGWPCDPFRILRASDHKAAAAPVPGRFEQQVVE